MKGIFIYLYAYKTVIISVLWLSNLTKKKTFCEHMRLQKKFQFTLGVLKMVLSSEVKNIRKDWNRGSSIPFLILLDCRMVSMIFPTNTELLPYRTVL
jgi:hypothetical protein